jgi:hypothetical protein
MVVKLVTFYSTTTDLGNIAVVDNAKAKKMRGRLCGI